MKTLEELRKLDIKKLLEELNEAKKTLFKIRFEVNNGQSKNHHKIPIRRKHIAQIKTIIKEINEPKEKKEEKLSKTK
jgi:ribosomal protein L29